MSQRFTWLSYLVLLFFMVPLHKSNAASLSTGELRDLQQKMKSATQLSVEFSQIKTTSIRPDVPSKSSGKAVFAKPNKFRWEIGKTTLVFDGSDLYSLNSVDKSASKFGAASDRFQEIQEVIDLVLDFDSLLKKYDLVDSSKVGEVVKLQLKPKKPGAIKEVEVLVDASSATFQAVTMVFGNKNKSAFVFSNVDRSVVPASVFVVPKDFKVSDAL